MFGITSRDCSIVETWLVNYFTLRIACWDFSKFYSSKIMYEGYFFWSSIDLEWSIFKFLLNELAYPPPIDSDDRGICVGI